MTNAELISMVRSIAKHGADWRINEVLNRAADALEAAEQRIAELEAQLPKEGEWIKHGCEEDEFTYWECPFCGFIGLEYHYCPNCGARMRGSNDEQIH